MKNICIILCTLLIIYGCNSGEQKAKPTSIQKEKPVPSASDTVLQAWMQGKVWTAEDGEAPMSFLKLKTDGTYEMKTSKQPDSWQIIGGKILLARLTDWPVEKLSDTAFRLYVKPTDKWFTYKYTSPIE